MGDIYNDTEEYNQNKKCKIIIVFDNIIADMLSNKTLIQQQPNYLLKVRK